jgi:hypothetical protein
MSLTWFGKKGLLNLIAAEHPLVQLRVVATPDLMGASGLTVF